MIRFMPHIDLPAYRPPCIFFNGHLQTIYPALFRKPVVAYRRERIDTPDGDFLDLDWAEAGHDRLAILLHGLEGSSEGQYIKGLVRALQRRGWDALAMNFRGCSGEANRLLRSYHSGETGDIDTVVAHVAGRARYGKIAMAGFSLGGNISLKYLGELGEQAAGRIAAAAAISVPCDLATSSRQLARPANYFYMRRFLRRLDKKVAAKRPLLPTPPPAVLRMKAFPEFDRAFTAPIHGVAGAADYYSPRRSRPLLPPLPIPTLLINAWNDPFLSPECFPVEEAQENPAFTLLTPQNGGHVGFPRWHKSGEYWHESLLTDFLSQHS